MNSSVRLTLLGVGAMNSPRFRPAGLLVETDGATLVFDGGDADVVPDRVDAWLVCDVHAELMPRIRRLARSHGTEPKIGPWARDGVDVSALPVVHTSHPTVGYLVSVGGRRAGWAPEFWRYPDWAANLDLLFADAAGWRRPIRFRGGVGGHACVLDVASQARLHRVRRLVFAHIGRATIAAIDAGQHAEFGEFGYDGEEFEL